MTTIESLRALHDRPGATTPARKNLRSRARAMAEKLLGITWRTPVGGSPRQSRALSAKPRSSLGERSGRMRQGAKEDQAIARIDRSKAG